jgi:hypothetical protein
MYENVDKISVHSPSLDSTFPTSLYLKVGKYYNNPHFRNVAPTWLISQVDIAEPERPRLTGCCILLCMQSHVPRKGKYHCHPYSVAWNSNA